MEFSLKTLVGFLLAVLVAVVIGFLVETQLTGAELELISIIKVN